MTTEQDITRLDARIDTLETNIRADIRNLRDEIRSLRDYTDMKFDGNHAGFLDLSARLGEVKGLIKTAAILIPASIAVATAILGWILTHSKFTG